MLAECSFTLNMPDSDVYVAHAKDFSKSCFFAMVSYGDGGHGGLMVSTFALYLRVGVQFPPVLPVLQRFPPPVQRYCLFLFK